MEEKAIAQTVVDAAYPIYAALGPGLPKSVYVAALHEALKKRGFTVQTDVPIPLIYNDVSLQEMADRADMIIEDKVVVEVTSVENLLLGHTKQLPIHLRLLDKRLGLLINFGASHIKDNIIGIVNDMPD